MHVEHSQNCIWITIFVVQFDCSSHLRLAQNKLNQLVRIQALCIALKQLYGQFFQALIVDIRIEIEKVESNINKTLLSALLSTYQNSVYKSLTTSESLSASSWFVFRLDMGV